MKPCGKLLRLRLPMSRGVETLTPFAKVSVTELTTNRASMATLK